MTAACDSVGCLLLHGSTFSKGGVTNEGVVSKSVEMVLVLWFSRTTRRKITKSEWSADAVGLARETWWCSTSQRWWRVLCLPMVRAPHHCTLRLLNQLRCCRRGPLFSMECFRAVGLGAEHLGRWCWIWSRDVP